MKTTINGMSVEGTPAEIVEYCDLIIRKPNTTFAHTPLTPIKTAKQTVTPMTIPHAITRRKTKWNVKLVAHLFKHKKAFPCETVREELGIPKKKWSSGTGYALRKRVSETYGWKVAANNFGSMFYPKGTKAPILPKTHYMQRKHDVNTRLAGIGRYFRVNREQAEVLAGTAIKSVEIVNDDKASFAKMWTKTFSKDGVHISTDFFEGLANTLKDKDPARVRSYLKPYFTENQYTHVFAPFVFMCGKIFCKLHDLKGTIVVKNNEIYLEE